jgi:succinate-semialdehyde dehydrogenase/glutarate-semialdehyde dehydrogenase
MRKTNIESSMKPHPLYLNNKWITTDTSIDVHNPANHELIGRVCTLDRPAIATAVSDAYKGFEDWRSLTGQQRGQYLFAVADHLERRKDEVARTITLENGKPLAQAQGEVGMAADHLRWFAEEARRAYGRIIPHQVPGKRNLVIKTPVGVVGAICPWNFPLVLACRKAAPALAAGCTFVHKPASYTPLSAVALAECVEAAGLPPGVYQLVFGSASDIGAEFLENPQCRKVTFTGSTEVGKKLIAGAAATVKPLSLELGGNAPVLVFDDVDLDEAVDGVMVTKFRNIGQSCIASNRIYVQEKIYEAFVTKFVEKTNAMKVGNGLDDGVEIGPLIDEAAVDTALLHIEDAVAKGARLLCGGTRIDGLPANFIEPGVLADVPESAVCMHEETFAPVAVFASFSTEEEGVARANNTCYGLAAYLFTRDLNRTFRVSERLDAGSIGVNDGAPSTSQSPFGGIKESGWGRELGTEGMDAFLETKHLSLGGVS